MKKTTTITIKANSREALTAWLTTGQNWKLPYTKGVKVLVETGGIKFGLDCPGLYRVLDGLGY